MSELLRKHEQSCQAAETLLDRDKLYAASVHCAYYSCIQLLIHTFLHHIVAPNTTQQQFYDDMNDDGGTHKYLRVQMKRKLLRLGVSQTDAAEFDTTLKELKQVRTDADYLNLRINETESREARRMSEQVNTLIKDTFSIT